MGGRRSDKRLHPCAASIARAGANRHYRAPMNAPAIPSRIPTRVPRCREVRRACTMGTISGCRRHALPGLLAILAGAAARADAVEWGGMLALNSETVYRGISQTDGRPGWAADLHMEVGPLWTLGIGATAERLPGQSAGAQLSVYLDRHWRLGDEWAARLGLRHIESPWRAMPSHARHDELAGAIDWRGRWQASLAFSPNYPGYSREGRLLHGRAWSAELTWHQPLGNGFLVDAGIGHSDFPGALKLSYPYASVSLGHALGDVFFYATRIWTGSLGEPANFWIEEPGSRWVAALVWSF